MEHTRRRLVMALVLLPLLAVLPSCKANGQGQDQYDQSSADPQRRFEDIAPTLVVDAVEGAEMLGVEFFADDQSWPFYAKSRMVITNREIMSFPGGHVPMKVRAVWRDNAIAIDAPPGGGGGISYGGKVLGDYTIAVASRIPDDVLRDIRAKGGGLRLKFRLKPDGVLFGWDIERDGGGISKFGMPGGDFLETKY